LAERLAYLREFDARRETILGSIREQGKLTDELEAKISAASTKAELEDIYLPFKPKRRTKAEIAREHGLGRLAEAILADRAAVPSVLALAYVNDTVPDVKAALEGARNILSEQFAENADLVGTLRSYMKDRAFLRSRVVDGKQAAGAKFSDYFDHVERWATVPSHRALAMLRGRNEDVLSLDIEIDADDTSPVKPVQRMIADAYAIGGQLPGDQWLMEVAGWTWRVKLSLHLLIASCANCASGPRRKRSRSLRAISRIFSWRRLPARVPRWDWIPASVRASRWRWLTALGSCSRRRPSIRSRRKTMCAAHRPNWLAWSASMMSN
jgi:uncharacterized protein